MKNKYRILKILSTVIIFGFLLSFSLKRFNQAALGQITINMIYPEGLEKVYFIDEKNVVDFIKQYNPSHKIGAVDIPNLEREVSKFPSVDSANVYLKLNGNLHVDIQQRVPVFRLQRNGQVFYVDTKGEEFPLSKVYTHPVILVHGNVKRNEYGKLIDLVRKINEDVFLNKYFVGVLKEKEDYYLITSEGHFRVELGNLEQIDFKIKGFRQFVEKFLVYQNPMKYQKISLKFNNQIVTTINPNYREINEIVANPKK